MRGSPHSTFTNGGHAPVDAVFDQKYGRQSTGLSFCAMTVPMGYIMTVVEEQSAKNKCRTFSRYNKTPIPSLQLIHFKHACGSIIVHL